jgi:hypothetical protein
MSHCQVIKMTLQCHNDRVVLIDAAENCTTILPKDSTKQVLFSLACLESSIIDGI